MSSYFFLTSFILVTTRNKMTNFFTNRNVKNLKSKLKPTFDFDCNSDDLRKKGVLTLPEAWIKECPRPIASEDSIDSLGFSGVRSDGSVIITRITRKVNRTAEVLLYLKLSNGDEYQLPNHPHVHFYNTDGKSFSVAGLCFEVLEPLRCWRVMFNGYLRKGIRSHWDESEEGVIPVRFNFIWHPIYGYVGFPEDFSLQSMVQLLISSKSISDVSSPYDLFKQDWQEQFGQLQGTMTIDNQESELLFRGLKLRRNGVINENGFNMSFQGILSNGTTFHLFVTSDDILKKFHYCYVCSADGIRILHVNQCDLNVDKLINEQKFPDNLAINFSADEFKFSLKTTLEKDTGMTVYTGEEWDRVVNVQLVKLTVNNEDGNGIVEIAIPNNAQSICPIPKQQSVVHLADLSHLQSCDRLVVEFSEDECKSSQIVGGKGSSLALLSSLDYNTRNFIVPDGICLTKTAFELHIKQNPQLSGAIDQLSYIAGHNREMLEEECKKLHTTIMSTVLSEDIKTPILKKLSEIFKENCEQKKFAVRSSAIGEDGEELSAAGQNDTILGVKGFEQIYTAVIKCWASQFGFRSVEYKRQNGQPLYSGMGVVIQEMVDADVAGVLFSRDPIKGSLENIVITSNFGLGESVVSASAEPDYIILKRAWNDTLHPTNQNVIGSKQHIISMNDEGGVNEVALDSDKCSKLTIDHEMALQLGNIALQLEKCYGNARDIEWAICNDIIYLLQSRPLTGNNNMTDFEIIHEFDTAMRTDKEFYSTANIGEVMPGAQTPLTTSSVIRTQIPLFERSMMWKIKFHRYDPTVTTFFAVHYGHVMQDLISLKSWNLEKKKSTATKAMETGFYGRLLDDTEVMEIALKRFTKPPFFSKMSMLTMMVKGVLFGKSITQNVRKNYENYTDPAINGQTVEEVYSRIGQHLIDIEDSMFGHMYTTMASTLWNMITLNILSVGDGDFELEQYSDFALLVGSCNGAESGNVPFSLQELASCIAKEKEPSQFLELDTKEALEWLQSDNHLAGQKYKEFINRHGHRGLKEFDMICSSWALEPEQIVTVVQNILKSPAALKETEQKSINEVISAMKTPLSPMKRRLLKWVMEKCRQAVCNREFTKSIGIKVFEGMRLAYRRLAAMMVADGLIPDAKLIYFFTHDEIDRLIKTRSPLLIQRAKQRLRMHPYKDKLKFDEFMKGYPIPIDVNEKIILPGDAVEIKGYPVSNGKIEGRARVVISFHDVHTIQPGEILITHATDIGWSPYFPMLGGVVTELGGLISHGAVVAREFGLPCVVGAQNATRVFKTGDTILLDAAKGTITRIATLDEQDNS